MAPYYYYYYATKSPACIDKYREEQKVLICDPSFHVLLMLTCACVKSFGSINFHSAFDTYIRTDII